MLTLRSAATATLLTQTQKASIVITDSEVKSRVFSRKSGGGLIGTSQAELRIETTPVELVVVGEALVTEGVHQAAFIGKAGVGAAQDIDYAAFSIRGIFDYCGCLEGECTGIIDAACDRKEYEFSADMFHESGRTFSEDSGEASGKDTYTEVCAADQSFNYNSTIVRLTDDGQRFEPSSGKKYLFSPFCGTPTFFRV